MATWINKAAGTIAEKYNTAVSGLPSQLTTGPVSKLWRARIITNRLVSGLPKAGSVTPNLSSTIQSISNIGETVTTYVQEVAGIKAGPNPTLNKEHREELVDLAKNMDPRYYGGRNDAQPLDKSVSMPMTLGDGYVQGYGYHGPTISCSLNRTAYESIKSETSMLSGRPLEKDEVFIVNLSASPPMKIALQNRPSEIEVDPRTNWATIKSMGRNTPMYHYTGAEDVITINTSWYCNNSRWTSPDQIEPDQVLNNCRLLEAWSKADGYTKAPPVLGILWGQSDMFDGQKFILTSAKYTLRNFNAYGRKFDHEQSTQTVHSFKLYPFVAVQELVFKRVSSYNLTHNDFISSERQEKYIGA